MLLRTSSQHPDSTPKGLKGQIPSSFLLRFGEIATLCWLLSAGWVTESDSDWMLHKSCFPSRRTFLSSSAIFAFSAQLHVGFGSFYFYTQSKKLWALHVLLLCHNSRPILSPQGGFFSDFCVHINTTTSSIQHAQAHFAIQFCSGRDFILWSALEAQFLSWVDQNVLNVTSPFLPTPSPSFRFPPHRYTFKSCELIKNI